MTYQTNSQTSGFRMLSCAELDTVSGGHLHENGGYGYQPGTPDMDEFDNLFQQTFGLPSCFIAALGTLCQTPDGLSHITVTAYRGITDFQGDVEVRHAQDGTKMLFVQGLYQGDIMWVDGSAALDDSDLSGGLGAGKEGVQIHGSVVTEGGSVLNYRFTSQPGGN